MKKAEEAGKSRSKGEDASSRKPAPSIDRKPGTGGK